MFFKASELSWGTPASPLSFGSSWPNTDILSRTFAPDPAKHGRGPVNPRQSGIAIPGRQKWDKKKLMAMGNVGAGRPTD